MKCKCGYEGWAEIGNFPDERFGGKYRNETQHLRCPSCKTNAGIIFIESADSFRMALYFGRETGGELSVQGRLTLAPDSIAYTIQHGEFWSGTTIGAEDYERIRREALEKYGIPLKGIPFPTVEEVDSSRQWWRRVLGKDPLDSTWKPEEA